MASDEAEAWARTKALLAERPVTLGPYFSFIARRSPRRMLHLLSYYKFAAKMIGPNKRILEVGCSEGFGSLVVAEFASAYVGIDLDAPAIETAREQFADDRLDFQCADVLTDSFGEPFDAALSLDVIEHIYPEHEDAFVRAIAAHLVADGVMLVGTPNIEADRFAAPQSREGHVNLFSAERLRALCERHFRNVFMFSANDEIVHTGFSPMAHYLIGLCAGPRSGA